MASDPARIAARLARQAEVVRMRTEGMTYAAIGIELGVTDTRVMQIERDAKMLVPLTERVEAFRAMHQQRLEAALARFDEIIAARHPYVSHGRVMRSDAVVDVSTNEEGQTVLVVEEGAGEVLEDVGPVLAAHAEARKWLDSFSKTIGAAAPTRVDVNATTHVTYDIAGMPDKGALT